MMHLQAARQAASEDCAGLKLTVPEATIEGEAEEAEVEFDCALAERTSRALETKRLMKRILMELSIEVDEAVIDEDQDNFKQPRIEII
jgi:hypothetical protein